MNNISSQIKIGFTLGLTIIYHHLHIYRGEDHSAVLTIVTLCGQFCHLYFDEEPDTLAA